MRSRVSNTPSVPSTHLLVCIEASEYTPACIRHRLNYTVYIATGMDNLWQHSRVWLIASLTCVWLLSWRVLYWFHSFHLVRSASVFNVCICIWAAYISLLLFFSSSFCVDFVLFRLFISFFFTVYTSSCVACLPVWRCVLLWVTAIMVYLPSICSTMISCSSAFVLRGFNIFCISVFSALWDYFWRIFRYFEQVLLNFNDFFFIEFKLWIFFRSKFLFSTGTFCAHFVNQLAENSW